MNTNINIEQVENGFIVRYSSVAINAIGLNNPYHTLKEVHDYLDKAFKGK